MAALIGLSDIHAAVLTQDNDQGVAYEVPIKIAGAITATITPTSNTETLYADDGPRETASSMGEITLEVELSELTLSAQSLLLGCELDKGVITMKGSDTAPYVAVGFRSKKSNGKFRFVWLYKGKFALPEQDYATQADTPTFSTGTLTASFVTRIFDDEWQVMGDEDDPDFTGSATWFDSVYPLPVPAPPPGAQSAQRTRQTTKPVKEEQVNVEPA